MLCTCVTTVITVGYEMTTYTTTEGTGFVELCAVITSPQNGVVAPRPFLMTAIMFEDTAGNAIYSIHQEYTQ